MVPSNMTEVVRLVQSGRLAEARTMLENLCRQHSGDAQLWKSLGVVHGMLREPQDAERCLRNAANLDPDNPEIMAQLGKALKEQGKLDQADVSYREALALDSGNADYCNGLGTVQLALDRPREAIRYFRQAVAKQPGSALYRFNLGKALGVLGLEEQALNEYRIATGLKPDFLEAWGNLGVAYFGLGNIPEANRCFEKALTLKPDDSCATAGKVDVLDRQRRFSEAARLLAPYVEKRSKDARIALAYARIAPNIGAEDTAIKWLEGLLNAADNTPASLPALHFALGSLYDRQDRFASAFEHYKRANDLRAPAYADKSAVEYSGLMEAFSKDFMRTAPRARQPSTLPVFIVGMPRSGTSLVEQILASHPDVYGAGEFGNGIPALAKTLLEEGASMWSVDATRKITGRIINELSEEHLAKLVAMAPDASCVTDKMPHNFVNLGFISLLFPNARIIHCTRDPMDTCLSCYFQDFYGAHAYSYDLDSLGKYYREYARLMRHWQETLHNPILEVRYEELVADVERGSRQLLEFCGLPWNDACLNFHRSARMVITASYDQVRRPIYSRSVGRWKNYAHWLPALEKALR